MKNGVRRALEIAVVAVIIVLSFAIFFMRDKLQGIGEAGYLGVFLLCFLANATVFLPAPSLMIAASCALIMNPWLVALVAAVGSTLGEFVGYALGTVTKELSPRFKSFFDKLMEKIHSTSFLVFILAVLPLPFFDVVGIYSGGTKMNLIKFSLICFCGKFVKLLVYTRIYDILEWAVTLVPWLDKLDFGIK